MTTRPNQPPEDEQLLEQEEQEKEASQDALLEQDLKTLGTGTHLVGALGIGIVLRRLKIRWAYKILNQENLVEALVDLENPQRYQDIKEAHKLSGRLKKEKGKWHMSTEQTGRIGHSILIAGGVHRRVSKTEITLKTQSAIRRYGLEEEYAQIFQASINKWLIENPKGDINNQLISEATRLHLVQEGVISDSTELSSKKVKKITKQQSKEKRKELFRAEKGFREDVSQVRKIAIEQNADVLERTKRVVVETLDPETPVPTIESTREKERFVHEGVSTTRLAQGFTEGFFEEETPQTTPAKTTTVSVEPGQKEPTFDLEALAEGATGIAHPEEIIQETVTQHQAQAPQPAQPTHVLDKQRPQSQPPDQTPSSKPTSSTFLTTRFREKISSSINKKLSSVVSPISGGFRKLTSILPSFTGGVGSLGTNLMKKGLGKLAMSQALKTGINMVKDLALGAITGGGYTALKWGLRAASAILKMLGIDLDFGKLAILGIASIIILVFAIPFLLLNSQLVGLSKSLPYYGVKNSKKALYIKPSNISWNEFEKEFFASNKKSASKKIFYENNWLVFENEFLSSKNYSSP